MDQAELLRQVIDILETQQIPYMLVGSLASAVYGEPRLTQDIDVVVDLRPEQVAALCQAFPEPEFYRSLPAAAEAVHRGGQFNVIHPASGNKIDFLIARSDPWGREQLARRERKLILPDREGYAASVEDVILGKLLYYREGSSEKHLRDIAAMMNVSRDEIDIGYIEKWTTQLDLVEIWQAILGRLGNK